MITMERVGARHDGGTDGIGVTAGIDGRPRREARSGRVAGRRPVARDRRGPARPVPVRVRGGAMCPAPVVRTAPAPPRTGVVRRVTAGIGLVVASAAAVFGLGLLADVAGASTASAGSPVPVVAQP